MYSEQYKTLFKEIKDLKKMERLSCSWIGRFDIFEMVILSNGFPGGSVVKNPPALQEMLVWFLGWDLLEKEMTPTSVFLPGKSRGQQSLVGYSLWNHKSLTWLSDWKTTIPPKLIYRFNPCQNPSWLFIFAEIELLLKFIWKFKRQRIV